MFKVNSKDTKTRSESNLWKVHFSTHAFAFLYSRFQTFRSTLNAVFSEAHAQTLPVQNIIDRLNKDYPDAKYLQDEIDAAIERMTNDNHIMLSDGQVFLV